MAIHSTTANGLRRCGSDYTLHVDLRVQRLLRSATTLASTPGNSAPPLPIPRLAHKLKEHLLEYLIASPVRR